MAKDVIVVVQRDALPSEKESLDILLVSTTGAYPVAVYRDVDSVKAVYGDDGTCPNAKIVRKATTLFNQGKTTLADGLVDKIKIVSFAPPSSTPAAAAKFAVTVPNGELSLAKDTKLYLKVGGDENAKVEVTLSAAVTTGAQLAAQFAGKSFAKDGKTYSAAVSGSVVTLTATEAGAVDTIPASAILYTDAAMAERLDVALTAAFTNGADAKSAADNLISAIEQFQADEDNDWYYFMTDRDEPDFVKALARFAEASEPTEAELGAGVEDHRKFYMGQTTDKNFSCPVARAAVIYTEPSYISEEPDASYSGNVAPFYPTSVTWKFKRPQDGNAPTSAGTKLISLPKLTESERSQLLENHVNFLTEEYKRQYVKEGTCLDGEFIDVVIGGDWIVKRMRDLLYEILLENANIPYDDSGFGLIGTVVMQALAEAVDLDIIARDPESRAGIISVSIPKYADSTEEQRSTRTMPDITWEALLSGAIHRVKSKGVLRVTM